MTSPDACAALVTGARRGIGKAIAVALGAAGLRVAVTSRTGGGEGDLSLDATARQVRAVGSEAVSVVLDLRDRGSIDNALNEVLRAFGRIDVVVNNAIHHAPDDQTLIAEFDADAYEQAIVAQVVNTTYLVRRVLDNWSGDAPLTVVNLGSAAADHVPPRPVNQGGWAFGYAAEKAALHRLAPFLDLELRAQGVRAFTVDPGFVRTEALHEAMGDVPGAAPPELPAALVRWLVVDPAADDYLGGYLHAQDLPEGIRLPAPAG